MDEKSYEKVLIYDVSYKILLSTKPLDITFDKVDGFIRVYDGSTYFLLFDAENIMSFMIRLDIL